MTQDRININGVWYVREDVQKLPDVSEECYYYEVYAYETKNYAYEAHKTNLECVIEYTDKTTERPWKEEWWDNASFFHGVLNNNPEALEDLSDMSKEDIENLQSFLQFLKQKQWI